MRISDWSSDVCSSDLDQLAPLARVDRGHAAAEACVAAKAHLDEHQRVAVEHHQVEFAEAVVRVRRDRAQSLRSEEHTSELQSLMRISYAVFCLKKNRKQHPSQYLLLHTR